MHLTNNPAYLTVVYAVVNSLCDFVSVGDCDAGFYCRNGSDSQRPSGGNVGDAGICPSGFYCPTGEAFIYCLC